MKKWILCFLLGLPIAAWSAPQSAISKRSTVTLWPTFRQGAAREDAPDVKAIQYLLRSRGFYKSAPDGVFGAQTAAAVRAFQRKNGLKADGVVATRTFARLIKPLKRGDKGDAVRALQTLLREFVGHEAQYPLANTKVDGVFGIEIQSAVRDVQDEANIVGDVVAVDGIVGAQTWWVMFGGQFLSQ